MADPNNTPNREINQTDLDLVAQGGEVADNYLRQFPLELQTLIIQQLAPREIIRLCKTSVYFNQIFCQSDQTGLWTALYHRDISTMVLPPLINGHRDYRTSYQSIMDNLRTLKRDQAAADSAYRGYENLTFKLLGNNSPEEVLDTVLVSGAMIGRLDIVKEAIKRGATNVDLALTNAARVGQLEMVEQLLQRGGVVIDMAFEEAAGGGHLKLVDRLIQLGTTEGHSLDFAGALASAAHNGQLMMVNHLITQSATQSQPLGPEDFNRALSAAAENGHLTIVDRLIAAGATDFDSALIYAANGPQIDFNLGKQLAVINRLIEVGAADFNRVLLTSAQRGHLEIVDRLLNAGADDIDNALVMATEANHENVVDRLITAGASLESRNEALASAASLGHFNIVNILIASGANDLRPALANATVHRHLDVALRIVGELKYLGDLQPDDLTEVLSLASATGNSEIAADLIAAGAKNYSQIP